MQSSHPIYTENSVYDFTIDKIETSKTKEAKKLAKQNIRSNCVFLAKIKIRKLDFKANILY